MEAGGARAAVVVALGIAHVQRFPGSDARPAAGERERNGRGFLDPLDARDHRDREQTRDAQVVEQRWFPGAHANVGGGYEDDLLPDPPLRWIAECARALEVKFIDMGAAAKAAAPALRERLQDNDELVRATVKEALTNIEQSGAPPIGVK